MSTRSRIGIELKTGKIKHVYAHWDGYPEHNGKILLQHYTDRAKLQQLISLGAVSALAPNIGEKIGFDDREAQERNNQCLFYGRDRGEKDGIKARTTTVKSFLKLDWEEYAYVLGVDGKWRYFARHEADAGLRELTPEVCGIKTEESVDLDAADPEPVK